MNNYYTLMYTQNWMKEYRMKFLKREIIAEIIPDQNSAINNKKLLHTISILRISQFEPQVYLSYL